jgi:UDP-N-acetylglucosamine 2-epimerase (non-hydrolysing)
MMEVLNANMEKILDSKILEKEDLKKNGYILMSIHREENVDSERNFSQLLESIETISSVYKMPIIISTHPRTRKKLEEIEYDKKNKFLSFSKPYGFHEYNKLQLNAFCVISDSGTIAEESSILNLPAITIRNAHERPEGMDEGTLIMSGLDKDRIIESINIVTTQHDKDRAMKIVKDYDVDNVSKKVLRIILSYTDYINRTVWHKET